MTTSNEQLAGKIAHEINNVLMGISPFVELIRRAAPDNDKVLKAVDSIQESLRRGKALTGDILRFTRPAPVVLQPADLTAWLTRVREEIERGVSSGVKVTFELPNEPLLANADTQQLTQLLLILVRNADEAMQGNGTIDIALRPGVELEVRDSGAGMDEATMARAFEPLFTTKPRRAGLSLAIAAHVAEAHGGTLTITSTPGAGATFTLRF